MIDLNKSDGLWLVTLKRPERANALTEDMLGALVQVTRDARAEARALVFTGQGDVFSAGADLDEVKTGLATSPLWEDLSAAIEALPILTIAALNGTLAGGAFGMVLACDLRVAVARARFFYPVMRLGFLPQPSDPHRLAALIGPARAKMILMAGRRIEAKQALDWGLIDLIVEPDALIDACRELTADALAANPEHSSAIKALIREPKPPQS